MKYKTILLVALLSACTTKTPQTTIYSILFDVTDPLLAQPNAQEIAAFIDADNTEKNIHIRFAEISAVDFNSVTELMRPSFKSGLLSNAVVEKQKADGFNAELEDLLASKDSILPAQHSSIFQPIVSEIKVLQSLPDEYSKTLVVYSNLVENSHWLSYYRARDLYLLDNHSEQLVKKYLDRAKGLVKNSNIKVHIVYIPNNNFQNSRFLKLKNVYQDVFSELEISISFSANLTKAEHGL